MKINCDRKLLSVESISMLEIGSKKLIMPDIHHHVIMFTCLYDNVNGSSEFSRVQNSAKRNENITTERHFHRDRNDDAIEPCRGPSTIRGISMKISDSLSLFDQ